MRKEPERVTTFNEAGRVLWGTFNDIMSEPAVDLVDFFTSRDYQNLYSPVSFAMQLSAISIASSRHGVFEGAIASLAAWTLHGAIKYQFRQRNNSSIDSQR